MTKVFIDIETMPSHDPKILEAVAAKITPPGSMKKPETIEAWEKEKKPALVAKAQHDLGLKGATGEIFCISYAVGEGEVRTFSRELPVKSEGEVLQEFYWALDQDLAEGMRKPLFVGHNVTFDLRFLFHRSVILGIYPLVKLPYNSSSWSGDYYDTMYEWCGLREYIKLHELAEALGLDGKDGMDGSMVWDEIKAGNFEKVMLYCEDDVRITREVYKKLTFTGETN